MAVGNRGISYASECEKDLLVAARRRQFGVAGEENLHSWSRYSDRWHWVPTPVQAPGLHSGNGWPANWTRGRVHADARARRAQFLEATGVLMMRRRV